MMKDGAKSFGSCMLQQLKYDYNFQLKRGKRKERLQLLIDFQGSNLFIFSFNDTLILGMVITGFFFYYQFLVSGNCKNCYVEPNDKMLLNEVTGHSILLNCS